MIADIAHMLHTPIHVLMEMDFADALLWHDEAKRLMALVDKPR